LRAGRHVALMRHTDAPGGAGDPPGFRRDDCATQRNLSAKGRADAARISARLRSEGIAVERILSSPWCRCMDTATLLELGPVAAEPTFGNVVVLSDQRESLIAGAHAVIDKWTGSGILLVVTQVRTFGLSRASRRRAARSSWSEAEAAAAAKASVA